MLRFTTAALIGWCIVCGPLPAADTGAEGAAPRPNILFLFADDQRADTIGAWGNEHIDTPSIDRLVERGFSFRRNYCMGSIHGAVCQPSRAMLMSGRTLYHVKMDLAGAKLLPELLGEHGYVTFGTGKWHNGQQSFLRAFQQGRAVFFGGMSDHTKVPVLDVSPEHTLVNKREGETFSSELFADALIAFLRSHDAAAPFFAYAAFTAPHDPRQPPLPYRQRYYDRPPPLPANLLPQHPFHNGWMVGRDENLAPWPRTPDVIRDQICEYYGLITHLDEQLGRILKVFDEPRFRDNTYIIYSADHGLALGSHGLLGKQSLYDHSMGCPLIIAGPGIPHGETRALTYLYDLYPTLCDIAGIAPPPEVEGASLRPIWASERERVRETLVLTYEDKMRAVRDARWKLIRYPQINYTQLFDLEIDPAEMHNLADDPQQADRLVQMLNLLRDWQERLDDTQPLSVDKPQPLEIDLTGHERKPDQWQPKWIVEKYFANSREQK